MDVLEKAIAIVKARGARCAEKALERRTLHYPEDAGLHRLEGIRDACVDMVLELEALRAPAGG